MDPAVVMVHPPKRPPLQVKFVTIFLLSWVVLCSFAFFTVNKMAIDKSLCQGGGGPPGIPSQTFSNQAFQSQMAGLTPSQQAQVLPLLSRYNHALVLLLNRSCSSVMHCYSTRFMQVIAQQQALLANGGRPGGQQQPVPANSAAPQQHQSPQQQQQVMGLAQQQQGLGTAPGPQGLGAPTVGQPGLGAGQPRQPGGQTGLGQQFPNQMSGPYAGHMQVCATLNALKVLS